MSARTIVVTGAFGYSGRAVAERLLARGDRVRTLTNRAAGDDPLAERVEAHPLRFDDPGILAEALRGADVLVNTYWVRFDHGRETHERAVSNTRRLLDACVAAGVRRVVHVSITNPSEDSRLPYFRGKAMLERSLVESGLSHSIVRPAVLFGGGDVLVNNIAWSLRRLPIFGLPGRGRYGIRPVHVEDQAALIVEESLESRDATVDAVGPESFSFAEMVRLVRDAIGVRTPVLAMPPIVVRIAARILGRLVGDVLLTRDEIAGLRAGLLLTDGPATGETRLSVWVRQHATTLGTRYANELSRHYRGETHPNRSPASVDSTTTMPA